MLSVVLATCLLFWLLGGCVLMYLDVRAEAEHQSLLAELWDGE